MPDQLSLDVSSRPPIVRARIDGAWRTVRVLRRKGGFLTVAVFHPPAWRKHPKLIPEAGTKPL